MHRLRLVLPTSRRSYTVDLGSSWLPTGLSAEARVSAPQRPCQPTSRSAGGLKLVAEGAAAASLAALIQVRRRLRGRQPDGGRGGGGGGSLACRRPSIITALGQPGGGACLAAARPGHWQGWPGLCCRTHEHACTTRARTDTCARTHAHAHTHALIHAHAHRHMHCACACMWMLSRSGGLGILLACAGC